MRFHMDDDERALLAARLGYGDDATDAQMSDAFKTWIFQKPNAQPPHKSRLTHDELLSIRDNMTSGEEHGYAQNPTGWIGQG